MKLLSVFLSLILSLSATTAQAAPSAGYITVRTTVYSVTTTGDTCTLYLANGGRIDHAWGTDCQARKGQAIVLNYEERLVDGVACNLFWCWPAKVKQRVLKNYYLVG